MLTELGTLLEVANRGNVLLLAALAFFVWRIYSNHLPHIEKELRDLNTRVARIEGRHDLEGEGGKECK